ncbi:dihydrodipicolinate synthase family protein [Lichenicoccus sp.]|uniref:dihydrodipicolinate synthase family protein n=1 Tax=Lichenicoccus sp. TaxID=2781899 RepID=UPI003D121C25
MPTNDRPRAGTGDCIEGHWVASPTPLDALGGVDEGRLADHAASLVASGCDGVLLFGTTGEGTAFSAAERLSAARALLRHGIPPARIGLGVGMPAIPDAIALARQALGLGLSHLLALPPYYYRDVTPEGLTEAFSTLIDGIDDPRLRLTLYNIPQVSGVALPPATAAALRTRHGALVAGVKDSSGRFDSVLAYRQAAPGLAILVGHEPDIARSLQAGATGTICGLSNIAAAAVQAMFAGASAEATMLEVAGLIRGPFVPALKSIMAAQRGDEAWRRVRAPLVAAPAGYGAEAFDRLRRLAPATWRQQPGEHRQQPGEQP